MTASAVRAKPAGRTTAATEEDPPQHRTPLGKKVLRWSLPIYTAIAVIYMFLPIVVMILFSFNDPQGRQNITWQGFTIQNYFDVWSRPDITGPMFNSLLIAVVSTIVATIAGTLIGLALVRYKFRGRSSVNLLIYIPMATPEVIMGASLLALWASIGVARGLPTIIIAHVAFCISFVVVAIRARLAGFNRSLEEAAMDLGADEWTTFRKVTLPLILPGILAAAMLSFALSIDDYVITSFVSGQTLTFPLWVYGASRLGMPPEVNVLGTLIFVLAFLAIVAQILWSSRSARRDRLMSASPPEFAPAIRP